MPEFLPEYTKELKMKSRRIEADFKRTGINELENLFYKYWIEPDLSEFKPEADLDVLAIDSSSARIVANNGGVFYVIRALGLSKDSRYKKLLLDFDYCSDSIHKVSYFIGRMMEHLEHLVAIEAIENGFRGYLLFDGSIYGRLAHIPVETNFVNAKGMMLEYFDALTKLLRLCESREIPVVGISKESRTSFFREFLIKEIFEGIDVEGKLGYLLSLALDEKRRAIEEAEKTGEPKIIELIRELVDRKPDFQLLLHAKKPGYTHPLMLGGSQRWRREYRRISSDPEGFVRSYFPVSSRDDSFFRRAVKTAKNILDLPAIVSFHLLPSLNDTPMRIDVPSWYFGLEERISEVEWPQAVEVDLGEILRLISAGYCGLENYNVWLTAVDSEVRLTREVFESLYLPKFEEVVGRFATPRGYRRVRYP